MGRSPRARYLPSVVGAAGVGHEAVEVGLVHDDLDGGPLAGGPPHAHQLGRRHDLRVGRQLHELHLPTDMRRYDYERFSFRFYITSHSKS